MEKTPSEVKVNKEPVVTGGNVATPYPQGSRPGSFQCRVCGQVFTNQADLTEHLRMHEVSKVTANEGEKEGPAGVS